MNIAEKNESQSSQSARLSLGKFIAVHLERSFVPLMLLLLAVVDVPTYFYLKISHSRSISFVSYWWWLLLFGQRRNLRCFINLTMRWHRKDEEEELICRNSIMTEDLFVRRHHQQQPATIFHLWLLCASAGMPQSGVHVVGVIKRSVFRVAASSLDAFYGGSSMKLSSLNLLTDSNQSP